MQYVAVLPRSPGRTPEDVDSAPGEPPARAYLAVDETVVLPAVPGDGVDAPPCEEAAPGPVEGDADPVVTDAVLRELAELRALVQASTAREEGAQRRAFDRLYADLEHYKQAAAARQSRPLYGDLILVLDRLERAAEDQPGPAPARALLESVHLELTEVLERQGVLRYDPAPGEPFDRARHRAVATEDTDRAEADRTVAAARRAGYEHDGAVLRPADVVVRRHRPGPGAG